MLQEQVRRLFLVPPLTSLHLLQDRPCPCLCDGGDAVLLPHLSSFTTCHPACHFRCGKLPFPWGIKSAKLTAHLQSCVNATPVWNALSPSKHHFIFPVPHVQLPSFYLGLLNVILDFISYQDCPKAHYKYINCSTLILTCKGYAPSSTNAVTVWRDEWGQAVFARHRTQGHLCSPDPLFFLKFLCQDPVICFILKVLSIFKSPSPKQDLTSVN